MVESSSQLSEAVHECFNQVLGVGETLRPIFLIRAVLRPKPDLTSSPTSRACEAHANPTVFLFAWPEMVRVPSSRYPRNRPTRFRSAEDHWEKSPVGSKRIQNIGAGRFKV